MKIRSGFVSNSSTTSFCIVGYALEDSKLKEKLNFSKEIGEKILNWAKEDCDYEGNDLKEAFTAIEEEEGISEILYVLNINCYHNYDYGYAYIGNSITDMKDDETLRQFKERTRKELSSILNIDKDPSIIIEAWQDG